MTDPLTSTQISSRPRQIVPVYQVDAFTDQPFSGNPAAVCYLMVPRDDEWKQQVAMEMNLSETAFFSALEGNGKFELRWFTPTAEVYLCGHATLATAHVIWQTELAGAEDRLLFETKSGVLTARKKGDWIELDFPVESVTQCEVPAGLMEALGIEAAFFVGKNRMDYLIELDTPEAVAAVNPDFRALREVDARGVIVTAKADSPQMDFVSRFFAPAVGVDEDPVTGSAHCGLGPYWEERLGRSSLTGYQASHRGGIVQLEVQGERVLLRGQAVTVMQGVVSV